MPPRHNYWTIIFGNQPTSFRAATREELLPTFRQIQSKHPDAVMMWFASGRLWRSEEEFREARFKRREHDRGRDERDRPRDPRGPRPPAFARKPFKPGYGEAAPKPRDGGGDWRDRPRSPKPAWKDRPPREAPRENRAPRPEWRDRPRGPKPPAFARKPFKPDDRPRGPKPDWKDKAREGERPQAPRPKDRWRDRPVPPAGGGEKRGRDWRPGGQHKDPRDRFKVPRDVKRARFKQKAWRDRTNPKPPPPRKPRSGEGGPKKKDEE